MPYLRFSVVLRRLADTRLWSTRIAIILTVVLGLLTVSCLMGFAENDWAASFHDKYFAIYLQRAFVFEVGMFVFVTAFVLSLVMTIRRHRNDRRQKGKFNVA